MSVDIDKLKADFESGISYAKLADKYGISKGTISKYKKKHGWNRKDEKVVPKRVPKKSTVSNIVSSTVSKTKLSDIQSADDKRKQFCLLYLKYYNATKAYQKTYDCSYETARTNGPALLANTRIKKLLNELNQQQTADLYANANNILQKDLAILGADLGDYLTIETVEQPRLDADGNPATDTNGNPIIDHYNQIYIKDAKELDWSLVSEVHKGKDGLVVKLLDKQKAMKELLDRLPEPTGDVKTNPLVKAIKRSAETGKTKIDENDLEGNDGD